jgi:NTP pyrophosphatase (non-canonical NTP hydrolase)
MKDDPREKAFTESFVGLMKFNNYQKLAARTINPKLDKDSLILNGVMGCSGEAGEALDIMKKHLFQGHPLNEEAIIKELGDQLWYISETATGLGIELSYIANLNIQKLIKRYPDGFSQYKSLNRAEHDS